MTICWNRMMTWWRWLILNFLFFFIFIIVTIVRRFVSPNSCRHHSRVSSMTPWSPIEIITSVHLTEIVILLNLNIVVAIPATSSSNFVLVIIFKLCFFSLLNMYGYSCFMNLLLWSLSLSLKILQNLSLKI